MYSEIQNDLKENQEPQLLKQQPENKKKYIVPDYKVNLASKIDELFLVWVNLPETQSFVDGLLQTIDEEASDEVIPTTEIATEAPKFNFQSPLSSNNKVSNIKPKKLKAETDPLTKLFRVQENGDTLLSYPRFMEICKKNLHLPTFLCSLLFRRVKENEINLEKFLSKYSRESCRHELYFSIIRKKEKNAITSQDLKDLLFEILATHPELTFLQKTAQFQERYAETVIVLFLHSHNHRRKGEVSLKEWTLSNFAEVLDLLDNENSIKNFPAIFSYERFYEIYLKFWELDTDHDLYLNAVDLSRFQSGSLSNKIIERILNHPPLPPYGNSKPPKGKITYKDFVWLLLSEENKGTEASVEYWFRCLDVDGDGYVSGFELEYFYQEQSEKIKKCGLDVARFEDIYCQILDMVKPVDPARITLKDLKSCKQSQYFFNCFFNSNKFVEDEITAFEQEGEEEL